MIQEEIDNLKRSITSEENKLPTKESQGPDGFVDELYHLKN